MTRTNVLGTAMLVSTERQGQRLLLLDASEWLVNPFDLPVSRRWAPSCLVEFADTGDGSAFPVVMRNQDDGSVIRVRLLRPEKALPSRRSARARRRGVCARLLKRRIRRMIGAVTGAASASRDRTAPSLRAATADHRR